MHLSMEGWESPEGFSHGMEKESQSSCEQYKGSMCGRGIVYK
jgi:hypothetical protein